MASVTPLGNIIHTNQNAPAAAHVQQQVQSRADFANMIAGELALEKEEEIREIRPTEESGKVNPEEEHERQKKEQEQEREKRKKREEEKEEEPPPPPSRGLLDLRA